MDRQKFVERIGRHRDKNLESDMAMRHTTGSEHDQRQRAQWLVEQKRALLVRISEI